MTQASLEQAERVRQTLARCTDTSVQPLERWAVGGNQLFKNSQLYDATVGKDYTPTSADDFKRVLQALTQPDKGVWGFGGFQGAAYLLGAYFVQMFGAPNNWVVDSGGKLVKDIETDQYKQAVAYVRVLVDAGVMHPDSQITASQTAYRDMFVAGKIATAVQAFGNNWFDVWSKGQKADPRVDFSLVNPFPSQQGAKLITYLGAGYNSLAAVKAGPPDRRCSFRLDCRIRRWVCHLQPMTHRA